MKIGNTVTKTVLAGILALGLATSASASNITTDTGVNSGSGVNKVFTTNTNYGDEVKQNKGEYSVDTKAVNTLTQFWH